MGCTGIQICEVNIPLKILETNRTTRLVQMAFEMMKYVKHFSTSKGKKLKLKIGIHQGDVIAGVIGEKKPQFSLIGDTVNTTSRVCSTGESGEITLSEEAAKNLSNCLYSFKKKIVEAKGKGMINVFQIKKRSMKTAAKFHKITQLVLEKIREESGKNSPTRVRYHKQQSVLRVINLLKQSQSNGLENTLTVISDIQQTTPEINHLEESLGNQLPKEVNSYNIDDEDIKKKKIHLKFEIIKNNSLSESKFSLASHRKNRIYQKPKVKTSKIYSNQTQNQSKFSKKTILPLSLSSKKDIPNSSTIEVSKENDKGFRFLYLVNNKSYEFLKQLVQKSAFIEKIMFFLLFFFSIIRNFLLLSMIDFFEINLFFIMEVTYLFLLGFTLLFLKEFYAKIAKKTYARFYLMMLFSIGIASSLIEMYYSQIYQNYSTSLMNIISLHMVMTNIW